MYYILIDNNTNRQYLNNYTSESYCKESIVAKMKNCKSCDKEVAKGAKACPHCGQKLKMGFLAKAGIGVVLLIGVVVLALPSDEEVATQLAAVEQSAPADINPNGELAELFSVLSENTDIQRDNMEKELTGKVVQWTLPVFDVNISNEKKNIYRVQTSAKNNTVGTLITLHARNSDEVTFIEGLIEDSLITVKGEIAGASITRSIQIENARLVR